MASLKNALLLAGGTGTRLRPLTDVLPKCLMPIDGKPLLEIWLDQLCSAGFETIVVNTHYLADIVEAYVGTSPYADRIILDHEPVLLGTAGTLLKHARRFEGGPLLFAHADNLSVFDVSAFAQMHARRAGDILMTMMTFEADAPQQVGIVELDAENRVIAFHEKKPNPPGRLANAAVYIVEPEVAEKAASLNLEILDFSTEVMPLLIGRIQTFHNGLYHRDIGTPESLAMAQFEYPLVARASRPALWPNPELALAFRKAVAAAFGRGNETGGRAT
jgi:mannose-1-phosphate guanylyltransferase